MINMVCRFLARQCCFTTTLCISHTTCSRWDILTEPGGHISRIKKRTWALSLGKLLDIIIIHHKLSLVACCSFFHAIFAFIACQKLFQQTCTRLPPPLDSVATTADMVPAFREAAEHRWPGWWSDFFLDPDCAIKC